MGSWYETCGLTQLPILWQDKAVLFIISRNKDNLGRYCGTTSYYKPCLIPIYGTYEDYGLSENLTCKYSHVILKDLKKSKTLADLISDLRDSKDTKVMYIKRSVFDYILDNYEYDSYRDGDFKYKDAVKLIPAFIKELKQLKHDPGSVAEKYDLPIDIGSHCELKRHKEKVSDKEFLIMKPFLHGDQSEIVFVRNVLSDMIHQKASTKDCIDFVAELLKGVFIDEFMDVTRKCWLKQVGDGHQDTDSTPYKVLIKATEAGIVENDTERD